MNTAVEMARLRWLCRRGMKELDVLLESFLQHRFDSLDETQRTAFMRLLQLEDPDLNAMLLGKQPAPDNECDEILGLLRNQLSK